MNRIRLTTLLLCAAAGSVYGTVAQSDGATGPLSAASAGGCSHAPAGDRMRVDGGWRESNRGWVIATPTGQMRAAQPEHRYGDLVVAPTRTVGVQVAHVLRAEPGTDLARLTTVEMDASAASQLALEVRNGSTVALGVRPGLAGRKFADVVAALRRGGDVVFLGDCAYNLSTRPFSAFTTYQARHGDRRSARDIWLSVVRTPGGADDRALRDMFSGTPRWADIPAARRVVGLSTVPPTPPGLLRRLTEVELSVQLPAAWRGFAGALCTRTSLGWGGECARLGAAPSGPLPLAAFMAPGEDLQVWLMGPDGSIESAVGMVGRIPTRLAHPKASITLRAAAGITTVDQLSAVARSSHDALRAG